MARNTALDARRAERIAAELARWVICRRPYSRISPAASAKRSGSTEPPEAREEAEALRRP